MPKIYNLKKNFCYFLYLQLNFNNSILTITYKMLNKKSKSNLIEISNQFTIFYAKNKEKKSVYDVISGLDTLFVNKFNIYFSEKFLKSRFYLKGCFYQVQPLSLNS